MKEFMNLNKKVLKELKGQKNYSPVTTALTFENKLATTQTNIEHINNLLFEKGKHLVVAPTGSGKTYLFSHCFQLHMQKAEAFKKFANGVMKEDALYILACPNKLQNEQNEQSYGLHALVAGSELTTATAKISAVYEKAEAILEFKRDYEFKTKKALRIVLVIDEAHTLISNINFRSEAIQQLFMLSDEATTTIFTTATPNALSCLAFDTLTFFKDAQYQAKIGKLIIEETTDVQATAVNYAKTAEKPFIRINNKRLGQDIIRESGRNGVAVSGESKAYTVENGVKRYENVVYDGIIQRETLPNIEIDVVTTTSVLDAGTSIAQYHPGTHPIFAIEQANQMQLDDIEQFLNRIRGEVAQATIVKPSLNNEEREFKTLAQLVWATKQTVNKAKKAFEARLKAVKMTTDSQKQIEADIQAQLNFIAPNGEANSLGCIEYTNGRIVVNQLKLFRRAYQAYNAQYCYFTEAFAQALENRLGVTIEVRQTVATKTKKDTQTKAEKDAQFRTELIVLKHLEQEEPAAFQTFIESKPLASRQLAETFEYVAEYKAVNVLKQLVKQGMDVEEAKALVYATQTLTEANTHIHSFIIRSNNRDLMTGKPVTGEYGQIQAVLFDIFYTKDAKGYMKKTRLSDKKITEACERLSVETGKKWTPTKVKNMVVKMFNISVSNNNTTLLSSIKK